MPGALPCLVLMVLAGTPGSGGSAAVGSPPQQLVKSLGLSASYARYVDAAGLPVLGSARTSPYAILEAAYIVRGMVGGRSDLVEALVRDRVRVVVMAPGEMTTDVPEDSDLAPKNYFDRRSRGLGPTLARPAVSCAEENLLGYRDDPFQGESILVHEFGHAIQLALEAKDETFDRRLLVAYASAMERGIWKETYAASNPEEYWAEGVQSWFDANQSPDVDHNFVRSRERIEAYDAGLSRLLREVFGDNAWRWRPPDLRPTLGHLEGFIWEGTPTFSWPARLANALADGQDSARAGTWPVKVAVVPPTLAGLRSPRSNRATMLRFENGTSGPVPVEWIDDRGQRRSYGSILPGGTMNMSSWVGHIFVLTRGVGPRLLATASESPVRVLIGPAD